jgi:signal transduction histidine kinase
MQAKPFTPAASSGANGQHAAERPTDAPVDAPADAPADAKDAREIIRSLDAAFTADANGEAGVAEHLAQNLVELGPPLAVRDEAGCFAFANAAFREIAGALAAAGAWVTTEDLVAAIDAMGGPFHQDVRLEIDGSDRYFLVTHEILHAGDDGHVLVVSRYTPNDGLGDRLRELELSHERLQDLSRLASEVVWECDANLRFTFVSPRIVHLLGHHPQELVGGTWDGLAKDASRLTEALSDPEKRAPFRGLEVRLLDRDNGEHLYLVHGLPVYCRKDGAFLGFRGTAEDISDLVAQDSALRYAAEAAEIANRSKSEFLANMSHELRTPLNAIIGFTEMMAEEKFGPIGCARYQDYLNNVLESARHLLTLINEILDVAKIEAGKLELTEKDVDPTALIRAALRMMSETAERRGIELVERAPTAPVTLWADENKLRQILLNLLSNALKFTPEGGRVECDGQLDPDGGFRFEVRDTGIGIEAEDIRTALAPFGQVDSRLNRKHGGTGLGLPLSTSLAEAHDATLRLDSTPGEGTTVTLRLPASRVHTA